MSLCLSVLSGTSTLCLDLLFVFQLQQKRPSEGSKQRGHEQKATRGKGTMQERSNTRSMKDRGFTRLRTHTRDERQDRGHGIFDVHVRGKRDAERLREYR